MGETLERVIETLYQSDGSIIFRRSDGSTIWKGGQGESGQSEKVILSTLVRYNYSTVVNPPPNQGQVRSNVGDGSAEEITTLYMHRSDYDNRDIKFLFMQQAKKGSRLFVQDINNSDSCVVFILAEDPVDKGSYIELNVELSDSNGTPLAGSGILIGLFV